MKINKGKIYIIIVINLFLSSIVLNAQNQKYFIKINDEKFKIQKDSCGHILKIRLFVNKEPEGFSFEYSSEFENILEPRIKYFIEKKNIKDFVDYDWLVKQNKITAKGFTDSQIHEVVFIKEYNRRYYEAYTTWVVYEVE